MIFLLVLFFINMEIKIILNYEWIPYAVLNQDSEFFSFVLSNDLISGFDKLS